MKKNPFYGMSAAAMLFGCYMVNHALGIEPGRLGKLLTLMGVLQVYEGLLITLGVCLVTTRRAPRDGVTVLALETVFLLDATLLATECVTASSSVGSAVVVVLVGLAVGKLALVRHFLPDTLPQPVAVLLGLQAAVVFGLPVVAVQLASARLLAPVSSYGLWWLTLALPLAQKEMRDAGASAVLVSLGQSEALGFPLLGAAGPWISPLRLATLGAAAAYALLAWRHGYPLRPLAGHGAGAGLPLQRDAVPFANAGPREVKVRPAA